MNIKESYCISKCPQSDDEIVLGVKDKKVPVKASTLVFGHLCVPKSFDMVMFMKKELTS